jgi:4-amino-4-deoxy-L-arabinose transferase-like glycosyltransferase
VSGVIMIPGLFLRDFTPINELKYILIAKEMLVQDKWFILFELDQFYTDKPPFFFWLINLTKMLTGTYSLGVIGFFSVIPGMLAAITAYLLVKKFVDSKCALPAALMLMSTTGFLVAGSCIRMDMLMNLFIIIALTLFFLVYDRYQRTGVVANKSYLIYLCIGLAILIKGPAGIIVPLLTIVTFLLLEKDIGFTKKMHVGTGVLIVLGLFLLWIVPATFSGGKEYMDLLLVKQTVGRGINAYTHKRPFYFYIEKSPQFFFPWFILFYVTVGYFLLNLKQSTSFEKFLLAWTVSTFIFFSLVSSKLEIYLLPMVFPLPLLSFCLLKREIARQRILLLISVGLPSLVLAMLPVAILLLDEKIDIVNLREDFLLGSILVSGCAIWSLVYANRNKYKNAVTLLATAIFILVVNGEIKVPKYNPVLGFKDMSRVINRIKAEESVEKIFAYQLSEGKYMSVYIDHPVEHITSLAPVQQAAGNKKVLIFGKAKKTDQLLTVDNSEILYKNAQFVLVGR